MTTDADRAFEELRRIRAVIGAADGTTTLEAVRAAVSPGYLVDPTPEQFSALGQRIASVLELRSSLQYRDRRYSTTWGSKSHEGIGRTVLRIVSEWGPVPRSSGSPPVDYEVEHAIRLSGKTS